MINDAREIVDLLYFKNVRMRDDLEIFGREIAKHESVYGLPPAISAAEISNRLPLTVEEEAYVVYCYTSEKTLHKVRSGISDERLEKLQKKNRRTLVRSLEVGFAVFD